MNQASLPISHFLDEIAVRISVNNEFVGSGIILYSKDRTYCYLLTARHCFAKKEDPLPDLSNVNLEQYDSRTNSYTVYPIGLAKGSYLDIGSDLLSISISLVDIETYSPDLPGVKIGDDIVDNQSLCHFKGFPNVSDNKAVTVSCRYAERYGEEFAIVTDTDFESNLSKFAQENTGGFSGSGIIVSFEDEMFLVGIVLRYQSSMRRFQCISLQKLIEHLNISGLPPLAYVRREQLEIDQTIRDGVRRIRQHSNAYELKLTDQIGSIQLPRSEIVESLTQQLDIQQLLVVWGHPGRGKSVAVKHLLIEQREKGADVLMFDAIRLNYSSLIDSLHRLGVQDLDEKIWQSPAWKKPLIVLIDGVEKLVDADTLGALVDIIQLPKKYEQVKIILTCRHYVLNQLKLDLHYHLPSRNKFEEIPLLKEEEVQEIAGKYPLLTRLLANSRLTYLLHTPFYLDLVVRYIDSQSVSDELTETSLKELLWKQVIEKGKTARGQKFSEIVLLKARQMTPYVLANNQSEVLDAFCNEDILMRDIYNSDHITPSHDIFEDWALSRFVQSTFLANQQPEIFFGSLSKVPAIRRAYRRWLVEQFEGPDSPIKVDVEAFVNRVINSSTIDRIWLDETIVSLLKSDTSKVYWEMLPPDWVFEDNYQPLWKIMGLLKTACQEPDEVKIRLIPPKFLETPFQSYYLKPVGYGWEMIVKIIYDNHNLLSERTSYLLDFFVNEWQKKISINGPLPTEAKWVGILLMEWLRQFEEGSLSLTESEQQGSLKLLFKLVSFIPDDVTELINRASSSILREEGGASEHDWQLLEYYQNVVKYALGWDHSLNLCKTLPYVVADLALKHWRSDYKSDVQSTDAHAYLYGIDEDWDNEYRESCAYQTCIWHLLLYEPGIAFGLISEIMEFSVNAYEKHYSEELDQISFLVEGITYVQRGNRLYWVMYRGGGVTSNLITSVLMTLERWLLSIAGPGGKISDQNLDFIYKYFLTESSCVATTSVLASVAMAYPTRIGIRILPILTVKDFYLWDSSRLTNDFGSGLSTYYLNPFYKKERQESNKLLHRRKRLEDLTFFLQTNGYSKEINPILDTFLEENPSEDIWRLALKRMDFRQYEPESRIEYNGGIAIKYSPKLEPNLQEVVDEVQKSMARDALPLEAFLWSKKVLNGEAECENSFDKWISFYEIHKSESLNIFEELLNNFSSAQEGIAVIGTKYHWQKLSIEQRRWCISKLLEKAVATQLHGNGSMLEGDTISILPLLLDKPELLREETEQIREVLFYALLHQVQNNLVVPKLISGVLENLWRTDTSFAIACVSGLVRLAYQDETLKNNTYRELSPGRADLYRIAIAKRVSQGNLGFKSAKLSQIQSINFWFLGRALSIIDWRTASDELIRLAVRCIELYLEYLNSSYQRKSYQTYKNRMHVGVLFNLEEEIGRSLYDLPIIIVKSHFRKILENNTNTRQRHEITESINRVLEKLILIEDSKASGKLWPLWEELTEIIRIHFSYELLRFLFLRFNYKNDGWKENAEYWKSLEGKLTVYKKWFEEFGSHDISAAVRLMSDIGLKELVPGCLPWLSNELVDQEKDDTLIHSLERLVQRSYYRHKQEMRSSNLYRESFLNILEWLIQCNSPVGYELRDRFI